jgi:Tol biopolymer transport system component
MGTGTMLSHYRLVEKLGEGGMGVVWRALDTTLDREVAVKILPETFEQHPDRLERFEREAKVLASLHHPNIAVLHGLHKDEGVRYLVMELVDGEDLAKRLSRGPLPTMDAMKLCAQVARALQAAHDRNVVHRDLKPANIVLTASGEAKVLDFGLAKVLDPERPDSDETSAPTVTTGGTLAGVILGTAAYMSPEQARGKPTDRRTDIWAFGCVLHECLTGVSEFKGDTMSDSIGAILHKSPDWDALPADLPVTVRWLLRRCLTKDRDNRLHDIADARIELEQAIVDPNAGGLAAAEVTTALQPARPAWLWPVAAAALVVLAAVATWWLKPAPALERTAVGLSFPLPVPQDRVGFTLSPDGTALVYSATDAQGEGDGEPERRLWLRRMDAFVPTPIPGTEGAYTPKFSPDGQTVAFQADRSGGGPHQADLRVVSLDGRPPLTVATNATDHADLSWLSESEIVYVDHENEKRLLAVSRGGGEPRTYAALPEDSVFSSFDFAVAGGGDWLMSNAFEEGGSTVFLIDPISGEKFVVMRDAKGAKILGDNLLFIRAGALLLAKLDLGASPPALIGDVQTIMGGSDPQKGIRTVEASEAGHLAFVTGLGANETRRLMTVDGDGNLEPLLDVAGAYRAPMGFSPDGKLLAVVQSTEETPAELWMVELDTGAKRPMAPDEMITMGAAWIPGDRLVFTSWKSADQGQILVREMHRNSTPAPLFADWPEDLRLEGGYLAFDGTNVAFEAIGERDDVDLWIRPVDGSKPARVLVGSQATERDPRFSPDGRWLAYASNESGRDEVYLRRHDPEGEPGASVLKISRTGGVEPHWSADGRDLFYRTSTFQFLRVRIQSFEPLQVAEPEIVVSDSRELRASSLWRRSPFLPMPDGERLVFVQNPDVAAKVEQIDMVLHWAEQLGR